MGEYDKKVLIADTLPWIKDSKIYMNNINFLIHDNSSIVKESYKIYTNINDNIDKEYPMKHVLIEETKGYDNNITHYNIRLQDDIIISYNCNGPAIDSNLYRITSSEKAFYNRRSKDIGKQISTGEIKATTILDYHTKYDIINKIESPSFIGINFFRSKDDNPNYPILDMITNTEFFYDINNKNNIPIIINGKEIRQRFDYNGNLYDYKKSNVKYGYDITGELIKLDSRAKLLFEGDKRDICPKMKIEDGKYIIKYTSIDKPYDIHLIETYILDKDTFVLEHIKNNDLGIDISFRWIENRKMYYYISKYSNGNINTLVYGHINHPTSGDYFSYIKYKETMTLSKMAYFDNIYRSDSDGTCYIVHNTIDRIIYETDKDTNEYRYIYDTKGNLQYQTRKINNGDEEIISKSNTIIFDNNYRYEEMLLYAEPSNRLNKKNILYIANEYNKEGILKSTYKALIIESELS